MKSKTKLSVYIGISILIILSIVYYAMKYFIEKQIVLSSEQGFFIYLYAIVIVLILIVGIILGYMSYRNYATTNQLILENNSLKSKVDILMQLILNLFKDLNLKIDDVGEKLDDAEDSILRKIVDGEITTLDLLKNQ